MFQSFLEEYLMNSMEECLEKKRRAAGRRDFHPMKYYGGKQKESKIK